MNRIQHFDTHALYLALDAERIHRGISWNRVAKEIWELSPEVIEQRPDDHPFSPSTIRSMKEKHRTSCQHALFMMRWLNMAPECFLEDPPVEAKNIIFPHAGTNKRPRWSLKRLYLILDKKRLAEGKTWTGVADILGCSPNQLIGLRTAKYATNIDLALRIVQWTNKPSTDFMYLANW